MGKIETSIEETYQCNAWGSLDALREIKANGIDGQRRNELHRFEAKYYPRTETAEFVNIGARVPASALLMGTSGSRQHDDCIGEFGEGLPLSLKQLVYLGHKVEIFNRDEKWTPKIEACAKYGGARILTIHTRKIQDRYAFIVKISGISKGLWAELETLFLNTCPTFDPEQTAKGRYENGRVLLQPEFKGRIYNKGVYVLHRENLLFGYDLDIELNRDRAMISDYRLTEYTNACLSSAVSDCEDFHDVLIGVMFNGDKELELQEWYTGLQYNESFRTKAADEFFSRFGQTAIPCDGAVEKSRADGIGLYGVVISDTLRCVLLREIDSLDKRMAEVAGMISKEIHVGTMPFEVKSTIDSVKDLMCWGLPEWDFDVKVVNFHGADMSASKSDDGNTVLLAENIALGEPSAVLKAILEVAPIPEGKTRIDVLCDIVIVMKG